MLRRKPTKIEVRVEDKEELEEARKRASAAAASSASSLLHHFDRSALDPSSKPHRIETATISRLLMEVEVKLRLPNKAAHQKLLYSLSPFHTTTHHQHNTFYDGATAELSSQRAVLRLRFHEEPDRPKCFVTLKANAVLANGVSRAEEDEEEMEYSMGKACFEDPQKLNDVDSRVLQRVKGEFGIESFVSLGGFKNVRNVYAWNGVKLEVDEVNYEFGDMYEIECESVEPYGVKKIITDLLNENGIEFSDSMKSKFAIFRSGKLPS